MFEFRPLTLSDRTLVNKILNSATYENSLYSFASLYSWSNGITTNAAFDGDCMVIRYFSGKETRFLYPVGRYDIKELIPKLLEAAHNEGAKLKILAETWQADELYSAFPGLFEGEDDRNSWDYVYLAQDLIKLTGNRYHSKRNHIARFLRRVGEERLSYQPLCTEHKQSCLEIARVWAQARPESTMELAAIERALTDFEPLDFRGAVLLHDDKVIAFTLGERHNDSTFAVRFEKALPEYADAYALINRMFAEREAKDFEYINREEDMGIEGMRTAKLSYRPVKMIEKCLITERD